MSASDGMIDLERLIELQAIYHLKGRRDHAVDRTHAETSPRASIMAADHSGENLLVGVAK